MENGNVRLQIRMREKSQRIPILICSTKQTVIVQQRIIKGKKAAGSKIGNQFPHQKLEQCTLS